MKTNINNTISVQEYPLPSSLGMERQVLADAVASPEALDDVLNIVPVEAFSSEARQLLWRTISDIWAKGDVVDGPTLCARCGEAYIAEIVAPCADGTQQGALRREAVQHAILLRDAYIRRRAYFGAADLLKAAADQTKNGTDLCAYAEGIVQSILNDFGAEGEVPLDVAVDKTIAGIEERRQLAAEGKQWRAVTGFPSLDYFLFGGFEPGTLIVLAARPSVGKTTFLLQMAVSAARNGFPGTIFSLEQRTEELVQRMMLGYGRISPVALAEGYVNQAELDEVASDLRKLPVYINDQSRRLEDVVARLTRQVRKGRCKVAFIDYLGLMAMSMDGREPLYQRISIITSTLQATAKRLQIPIVLLSQLNRDSAREDRPPELHDLRDSGSIEQDAEVVIMLSNEKAINPDTGLRDLNLWLRKIRKNGRDKCIRVRPNKTYSWFTEVGICEGNGPGTSLNKADDLPALDDEVPAKEPELEFEDHENAENVDAETGK